MERYSESDLSSRRSKPPTPPLSRELLEHRDFVRRLASSLARDPSEADDIEQDVWLRAFQFPPKHRSSLRGWLGRVAWSRAANRYQARGARRAHEGNVESKDAPRTPPELLELDATRELLVRSLERLDARYAEVLRLRYFEDLTPKRIAAQTGMPLDTVRTRLKRGLARMRTSLDQDCGGDRRVWTTALVALALGRRPSLVGTVAGVVGVAALGTALAVTAAARRAEPVDTVPGNGWSGVLDVGVPGTPGTPGAPASFPLGRVSTEGSTEPELVDELGTGSVRLRVVGSESGEPLPGVAVWMDEMLGAAGSDSLMSNAEGEVTWDDVASGWIEVGAVGSGARFARVSPGRETRIELRADSGIAVEAVVQSRDRPVPGAEVLGVWPDRPERVLFLGRADAEGRVRMASVHPRTWVWARADGYRSGRRLLVGDPAHDEPMVLPLSRRYCVRGTVRDEAGKPIAGARIELATPKTAIPNVRADGALGLDIRPEPVASRFDGTFELWDLPARRSFLEVSAPGHGRSTMPVFLTQSPSEDLSRMEIALPAASGEVDSVPAVAISGAVRWSAGRTPPGGVVVVRPHRTDLDPRARWSEVASDERRAVVDEDGSWSVEVEASDLYDVWLLEAGRDGARDRPAASFSAVDVSAGAIELEATAEPTARITGRVESDWQGARILLDSPSLLRPRTLSRTDGAGEFSFEGLPGGRYSIFLWEADGVLSELHDVELGPGTRFDVGILGAPEQGSIRAKVALPLGLPMAKTWVSLRGAERLKFGESRASSRFDSEGVWIGDLEPGIYQVMFGRMRCASVVIEIEVSVGHETAVDVRLPEGVVQRLRVVSASDEDRPYEVEVRRADGELVYRTSAHVRPPHVELRARFEPGAHVARVMADGELLVEHAFVVEAIEVAPIDLVLPTAAR